MTVSRTLLFTLLAITVVSVSAAAQATPRTKGVNLGIALNGSAIKFDDEDLGESDSESGGGISLQAGYNFTPNIGIFLGITGASIQAKEGGSYGLGHGDLGVRVSLGSSAVVPYIEAAYTGLNAKGDVDGDDIEFQGFGGTGTLGLNFFFSQRTALDVNFKYTKGEFNTFKINGDGITSGDGVGVATGRFNIGIAFYPSAGKARPVPVR